MKYCLLGLLLLAQSLHGQIVLPALMDVKNLKPTTITLDKKAQAELPSMFTSIVIHDLRADTVTVGYVKFAQEFKSYFRLQFGNGIRSAEAFVNSYFRTTAKDDSLRLHVLLKHMFITQDYKMPSTGINIVNDVYTSKVFVAASLVMERKDKSRYLLNEVDTVLTMNKWLGRAFNDMAQNGLVKLVEKAEDAYKEQRLTPVSKEAMAKIANAQHPLSGSFRDGFYASYEAFLQGRKDAVAARFEQKKKARVLQPLSAGDTATFRRCWGFVENGTLYVRHGNLFIPVQNSFGGWSGLGLATSEQYKMPWVWNPFSFAVDMVDIAISGPTSKSTHFKLFKLNTATGVLE